MSTTNYKKSETVNINRSQINFAPYNPKKHDKAAVDQIKKNFKKVAFLGGLVWNKLTGNLVDGHKRVMALDIIHKYDGTPATDYELKVEMCELDPKTEKEQNVFQTASRTELDYGLIADFINDISFQDAGLTQADVSMIEFENPNFDFAPAQNTKAAIQNVNEDFKQIKEEESEEAREAKIQKIKEVKQQQAAPSNYLKHIVITFETAEDRIYFMERLGIDAGVEFVPGTTLENLLFSE